MRGTTYKYVLADLPNLGLLFHEATPGLEHAIIIMRLVHVHHSIVQQFNTLHVLRAVEVDVRNLEVRALTNSTAVMLRHLLDFGRCATDRLGGGSFVLHTVISKACAQ